MALPKEPRQKMINLMYLVLTALLALNVSAEILNAFKTVNNSLEKTNVLVSASTETYMASLKQKLSEPESQEKARQWYPLAVKARQIAGAAYNKVKKLKDSLMFLSGFDPAKNHDSAYKEDDINVAERVVVDGGEGQKLYRTLSQFKTDILGIDPAINKEFAATFPLDLTPPKSKNKASDSWEGAYFHMTPTIAAVTILSKFQNDIRTAENKVVEFCHKQVGQVEVRFDQIAPIVTLSSNYLMNGQELDVTAGVGAFNSQNNPRISIDGAPSEATGSDGIVEKKEVVNGVGAHSVHIHMNYKDQGGKDQTYDHDFPYTVGEPTGISVSADAVKVLYIGLENPLTINSGNVGSEKVSATTDNGTIRRGDKPGQWIAQPSKPGLANINVSVDGKPYTFSFRVKSVPDPVGVVGVNKGGRMRANEFKAQFGVGALLENFIFDGVTFKVTSFTIVCTGAGFPVLRFADVQGNSFDPVRSAIIQEVRPGTTVTIDNIRAAGPGGTRPLPPIVYNLF